MQDKGTQESCFATGLTVSGFVVMGLVSGLSLTNTSDSRSFLVALASFSQDGFQPEGFWEVGRIYRLVSPFDPSQIFLVGNGLLVLYWDLLS